MSHCVDLTNDSPAAHLLHWGALTADDTQAIKLEQQCSLFPAHIILTGSDDGTTYTAHLDCCTKTAMYPKKKSMPLGIITGASVPKSSPRPMYTFYTLHVAHPLIGARWTCHCAVFHTRKLIILIVEDSNQE